VAGSVRANVSVVEPDGTVTKLNEPGPRLSAEEVEAVTAATVKAAADAEWLACTGSLPPGAPIDLYARVVERLGSASVKVAIDSSGAPLVAALEAGPDLIKPNREELAEATGRQLLTVGDVVEAAEELRGRGVGAVLASLGADGAVLVDATGATFGSATVERPRSAVGAGDSMLAGFLAGGGSGPGALAEALAWGAAAASLPGSIMPTPDDLDHGAVTLADRIDPDRPLKERS
jgi:1-phosphofructokinase